MLESHYNGIFSSLTSASSNCRLQHVRTCQTGDRPPKPKVAVDKGHVSFEYQSRKCSDNPLHLLTRSKEQLRAHPYSFKKVIPHKLMWTQHIRKHRHPRLSTLDEPLFVWAQTRCMLAQSFFCPWLQNPPDNIIAHPHIDNVALIPLLVCMQRDAVHERRFYPE